MKLPREYSIIILTIQNLVNDGWTFETNEDGELTKVFSDDERIIFISEKELKDWVLEKAMDY